LKGYRKKGKYVPGLIDMGIIETRNRGSYGTQFFGLKNKT